MRNSDLSVARVGAAALMCGIVGVGTVQGAPGASLPSPAILAATVAPVTTAMLEEDLSHPGSWVLNPELIRDRAMEHLWGFGNGSAPLEDSALLLTRLPDGGVVIEPELVDPDAYPGFTGWQVEILSGEETQVDSTSTAQEWVNEKDGEAGILTVTLGYSVAYFELDAPSHMNAMIADVVNVAYLAQSNDGENAVLEKSYVIPIEIGPQISEMQSLQIQFEAYRHLALRTEFDESVGAYNGPVGPRPHGLEVLECGRVRRGSNLDKICACWSTWVGCMNGINTARATCRSNARDELLRDLTICAIGGIATGGSGGLVLGGACGAVALIWYYHKAGLCDATYANAKRACTNFLAFCVNRNNQNSQDGSGWAPPFQFDPSNPPAGIAPGHLEGYHVAQ